MNRNFLLLMMLLVAFVSPASSQAGWRSNFNKLNESPLTSLPKVESKKENGNWLVHVQNNTDSALQYSGYGKDSPQMFIEEFKDGQWIDTQWAWCGTGLGDYSIPKGANVAFK